MQETSEIQVRSLGQEDPLGKERATPSRILAWEIPRTEEPGGLQSIGRKESDTTETTHTCRERTHHIILKRKENPA